MISDIAELYRILFNLPCTIIILGKKLKVGSLISNAVWVWYPMQIYIDGVVVI